MTQSRLETALAQGAVALPESGRLLALRCPSALAPALPLDRTDAVHGFAPEHDRWQAQGAQMRDAPDTGYACAIITCPRGRDHARRLVAQACQALAPGGLLIVDGQKTDGVEPLLKALKAAMAEVQVLSKAHGKLIWVQPPAPLPDVIAGWAGLTPAAPEGWVTAPGVFSAEAIDAGSALLAAHLPKLKGVGCDLGAGWGFLARAVLNSDAVARLDLVEAERAALEAAKTNITDPRAAFHWADATRFGTAKTYDFIVCNPPFHSGRAADPGLGQAFLRQAKVLLKPTGTLALVANRHLPYERTLDAGFAETQTVAQTDGFKVIHARRPKTDR